MGIGGKELCRVGQSGLEQVSKKMSEEKATGFNEDNP